MVGKREREREREIVSYHPPNSNYLPVACRILVAACCLPEVCRVGALVWVRVSRLAVDNETSELVNGRKQNSRAGQDDRDTTACRAGGNASHVQISNSVAILSFPFLSFPFLS